MDNCVVITEILSVNLCMIPVCRITCIPTCVFPVNAACALEQLHIRKYEMNMIGDKVKNWRE